MAKKFAVRPSSIALVVAIVAMTLVSVAAPAQAATYDHLASVQLGDQPQAVETDPATHTVYVTNQFENSLRVIDGTTNTVETIIPVGSDPVGLGLDAAGHRAYVGNYTGDDLSVVDTVSRTVIDTIPVGDRPFAVAVDAPRHRVYVANFGSDDVTVIDTTSNTVIDTIAIGDGPYTAAVDPETQKLFVSNRGDDTVSVIDLTTNSVIDTIAVAAHPAGVAIDLATHEVFVTNRNANRLTVIDGTTHAIITTLATSAAPVDVVVDSEDHRVYVANSSNSSFGVYDGITHQHVRNVGTTLVPIDIGVDPVLRRIYVVGQAGATLRVYEAPVVIRGLEPTISGVAQVGQTLTAQPGDVTPPEATFTYQWNVDGVPVPDATSSTLDLKKTHAGSTITVTITASLDADTWVTRTSDPTPSVRDKVKRPQLILDATTVARGGTVGLVGRGFSPGTTYTIRYDSTILGTGGTLVATLTADEYGELAAAIPVPTDSPTGPVAITVTGADPALMITTVTVTP